MHSAAFCLIFSLILLLNILLLLVVGICILTWKNIARFAVLRESNLLLLKFVFDNTMLQKETVF